MITHLHLPAPPLSHFITSFYYYSGFEPEHTIDRFLPDGNVQLIFELTDEPQHIYDNDTLREIQTCRRVWFSGFRTRPITIPSGRQSEMIIVNFQMGRAWPFLREPLHALTNTVVDAEQVLNIDILGLREALLEQPTPEQKLALLEETLLRHYQQQLVQNPFVDFAVAKILSSPRQLSLKDLAGKVGYSQKHVIKLFKDHVGVPPKEFLKVIRFQQAVAQIEQRGTVNWLALALDCGYYDQSHFIADFKSFSGFTPMEYLLRKGENLNYIPVL